MSQPTAYEPATSFTEHSASLPSVPHEGVDLDAEFNAIALTLQGVLANLALIQRDDGPLANLSVDIDQLSTAVLSLLSGVLNQVVLRGAWVTATVYAQFDVVTESGSTYICYTAHTSGTFATDLAAGDWIAIFGPSVAVIADGAVTTVKLADGAVTAAKLGFTSLTRTGSFTGEGGMFAGTGTVAMGTVAAKGATGDIISYTGRTTRAQGAVLLRLDGGTSGAIWDFRQPVSQDYFELYNSLGAVRTARFATDGQASWYATQQITGAGTPAAGAGIEFKYSSGTGIMSAYDRDASTFKALAFDALSYSWKLSGVSKVTLTTTGLAIPDGSTVNGITIGYKGLPKVSKTAAYQLVLSDAGKCISITIGGITIPANSAVAFPADDTIIEIYNDSATPQAIAITTDTLRLAGTTTTGTRTLGAYGKAFLEKMSATVWTISGPGVT